MEAKEFSRYRKILNRTQKQIAQLLGTSVKAIHSYEQGWRTIPNHAERQMLYLLAKKLRLGRACWTIKRCPVEQRRQCPAYEFDSGEVCWFICGTMCNCRKHDTWKEKIAICRQCEAFEHLMEKISEAETL